MIRCVMIDLDGTLLRKPERKRRASAMKMNMLYSAGRRPEDWESQLHALPVIFKNTVREPGRQSSAGTGGDRARRRRWLHPLLPERKAIVENFRR
ncbi:MAG: hypothetical protein ACLSFJ_08710 [Holdemania filiformis]